MADYPVHETAKDFTDRWTKEFVDLNGRGPNDLDKAMMSNYVLVSMMSEILQRLERMGVH